MRDKKHKFPSVILLPNEAIIENDRMRIALGNPSRQLVHIWRKKRNFPKSHRSGASTFFFTAEIEKWAIDMGMTTRRA